MRGRTFGAGRPNTSRHRSADSQRGAKRRWLTSNLSQKISRHIRMPRRYTTSGAIARQCISRVARRIISCRRSRTRIWKPRSSRAACPPTTSHMTGATFSRDSRSAAWGIFDEGTAWALANARDARGTVEAGRHRRPMIMRGFSGGRLSLRGFCRVDDLRTPAAQRGFSEGRPRVSPMQIAMTLAVEGRPRTLRRRAVSIITHP